MAELTRLLVGYWRDLFPRQPSVCPIEIGVTPCYVVPLTRSREPL
jgi:hypothetical protein